MNHEGCMILNLEQDVLFTRWGLEFTALPIHEPRACLLSLVSFQRHILTIGVAIETGFLTYLLNREVYRNAKVLWPGSSRHRWIILE